MMKTYAFAAALLASTLAAAPAAAATFVTFDGQSGVFGNDNVTASPFEDVITFELSADNPLVMANGLVSATISTTASSPMTDIDFTSVTLNDAPFTLFPAGSAEFGSITLTGLTAGTQTLVIRGTSGGNGSYSGTVTFAAGAIPEPATWAMMLAGFGLVGAGVRRRRAQATIVTA